MSKPKLNVRKIMCAQNLMDATFIIWRFIRNFRQISIFEFHKVVRQQDQGVVGEYYMDFVQRRVLFPAVKEFLKIG